jgi:hypothetical protein
MCTTERDGLVAEVWLAGHSTTPNSTLVIVTKPEWILFKREMRFGVRDWCDSAKAMFVDSDSLTVDLSFPSQQRNFGFRISNIENGNEGWTVSNFQIRGLE